MKKGITLGAIIVALGAALVFWLGGFQSGKGEVTPEQLPVSLEPMTYGAQAEAEAVWPVWSLQVVWRRQSAVYRDNVGPFMYQLQLKTRPTLADVEKLIPAPAMGEGIYKPVLLLNVVQVGQQVPVEQPEKDVQ